MNKEKRLKLKNHLPLVRDSSAVPEIIKYKIRPESNTKTALQVSWLVNMSSAGIPLCSLLRHKKESNEIPKDKHNDPGLSPTPRESSAPKIIGSVNAILYIVRLRLCFTVSKENSFMKTSKLAGQGLLPDRGVNIFSWFYDLGYYFNYNVCGLCLVCIRNKPVNQ